MILLIQKKIYSQKEGMYTCIIQAHMNIMRHGWLAQVHPFIWILTGSGFENINLMDGRIGTILSVLDIPILDKKIIFVSKMDDVVVKTLIGKYTSRMVRGETMLLKGVWFVKMYNIWGRTIVDGCNSSIVLEIGAKEEKTLILWRKDNVVE